MATFEILAANNGDSSSVVGYPEGTKMYVALLNQTGTDAPVATVLVNTLGGTVVWTYADTGQYNATLAGAFVSNKTQVYFGIRGASAFDIDYSFSGEDALGIASIQRSDGEHPDSLISGVSIQILVFP